MKNWIRRHKIISTILIVIAIVVFGSVALALVPVQLPPAQSPDPAVSYEDALGRVLEIQSQEKANPEINPTCYTRLLTHDQKVERAIVLLHGFTSCPEQFAQLGEEFYQRGYNVYIPRMPGHGYSDRLGEALKGITPERMADFAMSSVDVVQGLGEHVTVSGLSGGGALTVWLAQERQDIDLAAPMAPFLGVEFIPTALNQPFANLLYRLPDFFQWWDPVHKSGNPLTAEYAYPRYSIHAMDDFLVLGFSTRSLAKGTPPAAAKIVMITNAADPSVSNPINDLIVAIWREHGGAQVDTYEFPKDIDLPHDMITPTRPGNRVDLVYPKLFELLGAPAEPTIEQKPPEGALSETDSLTAFPWQWVRLTDPVQQYEIENPENYVLDFSTEDVLSLQADCNQTIGRFTVSGSSITIELGPTSLAACPPGSRSDEFLEKLGYAAIYFFQDRHLFIDLFADGGTLEFAPVESGA
jgi:pimeloyl-ACP methyl ester carboxylesterase/heat shock protein HslJ